MSKRASSTLSVLLLIGVVFLCLVSLLAGWFLFQLPTYASQTFGPSTNRLDRLQLALLSVRLLVHQDRLTAPLDAQGSARPFQVQLGESTASIVSRLQSEGFILDARALRDYLVYAGLDTSLQAGEYTLSPCMTPLEIARALQDATPSEVTFSILPGWRIEEIAAALPTSGLEFSPQAFLSNATSPPPGSPLAAELPSNATLEGFLFPDRYRLPRHIRPEDFVAILLEDFQAKVTDEVRQGFRRQGLTLYQAVTLASLIQREAVIEEEMPQIASVFFNRLKAGMKLDSDPTVQYALGYNAKRKTWWTNPLSLDNLKVDSPYNTYLYPGLPPGPISNPGLGALQAVAAPASTPYMYFRAACDNSGRHLFARTFAEHQANACP
jgi:UPF0755 protein